MPNITISIFEGCSQDDKKSMAEQITRVICDVRKCPPEAVTIKFEDMERANYYKAGVSYINQK